MQEKRLRADARRNYDRLLETARSTVAEQGAEASLEEIARRAGLGSATLHRHFPTREVLLEAVFQRQIDQLCDLADELLLREPPSEALFSWLRAFVAHAAVQRGLARALAGAGAVDGPRTGEDCRARIRDAGDRLLAQARRAGVVRDDVSIAELTKLVSAIAQASECDADSSAQAERLLEIVIVGVRVAGGRDNAA